MSSKQMKVFLFGGAVATVFFAILGFSMGWIVTSGSAHAAAVEMSEQAVKDKLVPICVHQFDAQPGRTAALKELKAIGAWEREGFVRDHGWATMPGSDSPAYGVARACAAYLSEIQS